MKEPESKYPYTVQLEPISSPGPQASYAITGIDVKLRAAEADVDERWLLVDYADSPRSGRVIASGSRDAVAAARRLLRHGDQNASQLIERWSLGT